MANELIQFPATGVVYSFPKPMPSSFQILRSPIKGYLRRFETTEHDLLEAVISPIITTSPWIYSIECFQAATAFNMLGFPLPRSFRIAFAKRLMLSDNFKKLVFWSQAARDTLHSYGRIDDERVLKKTTVVYPAIRQVSDRLIRFSDKDVLMLFSGDFFRKGGVNVIDAFERAQRFYPHISLRLCCDERLDFNTRNTQLKAEYLQKIKANKGIVAGRVSRDQLLATILPMVDIYLLPTYVETFGFALLEAMAYGIPVISTSHFEVLGFLWTVQLLILQGRGRTIQWPIRRSERRAERVARTPMSLSKKPCRCSWMGIQRLRWPSG